MAYAKYGAVKTEVDGITFASQLEAARYQELKLLERSGAIVNLELQPRFVLQEGFRDVKGRRHKPIIYVADFGYDEPGNPARVIEDAKGALTDVFKIKQKLFLCLYQHYDFRLVHREHRRTKRGKR